MPSLPIYGSIFYGQMFCSAVELSDPLPAFYLVVLVTIGWTIFTAQRTQGQARQEGAALSTPGYRG